MIRQTKSRPGLSRALLRRTGMKAPSVRPVLGVTGGVGCGKSTVLAVLKEEFGAEVIEADRVSEALMQPGEAVYEAVVREFGTEILGDGGQIDRKKLAETVYSEPSKLEQLNALVHPATLAEVKRRTLAASGPLVVYESAIPKEARFREMCTAVWYVFASEKTRTDRLISSRGYSEQKCRAIMARQMSEEEFRAFCDTVIDNDGAEEETRAQVRREIRKILKKESRP